MNRPTLQYCNLLSEKLVDAEFVIVDKASQSIPGLPVGTAVRVISTEVNASMYKTDCYYISVLVELPNGERRSVSGMSLGMSKQAKEKFLAFQNLYKS